MILQLKLKSHKPTHNCCKEINRLYHAIANYEKNIQSVYCLFLGDDRVILHEKTYFSRYKQVILSLICYDKKLPSICRCDTCNTVELIPFQTYLSEAHDGPITTLKWRGRFAAW